MFSSITAIVVTLTLLFGGAGATVFAAQDALPNEALYPLKTASEDFRLRLSEMEGEASGLSLYLNLANKRVQEMVSLTNQGQEVPAQVGDRWGELMDTALAMPATEKDPAEIEQLLNQIMHQIRDQERLMDQSGMPDHADPVMERVHSQIQNHLRLVEGGLEDPMMYQHHFRNRTRFNQPVEEEIIEPEEQSPIEEDEAGEVKQGEGQESGNQYGPGDETGPGPNNGPASKNEDPGTDPDAGSGPNAGPGGDEETDTQFGPGPEHQNHQDGEAPHRNQETDQGGGGKDNGGGGKR